MLSPTWCRPCRVRASGCRPDKLRPSGEAARVVDAVLAEGIDALAVVLVHAYANGDHERRIGQLVAQRAPRLSCSLSCDVLPEMGEYERTSTTVINAYVGPVVERYVGALQSGLQKAGIAAPLLMIQSTGGVMHAESARRLHLRGHAAIVGRAFSITISVPEPLARRRSQPPTTRSWAPSTSMSPTSSASRVGWSTASKLSVTPCSSTVPPPDGGARLRRDRHFHSNPG